jgi:hypothetical protein
MALSQVLFIGNLNGYQNNHWHTHLNGHYFAAMPKQTDKPPVKRGRPPTGDRKSVV